ncbi:MAG TPA: class I SAM-dependent methyltransferase [Acidimicrobiales bacterium]|nr:class I SAM-dependent methyltransferase [Acidimicrobiales bacterium]
MAARHLDQFNRRHPWSHNDHFHGWIVRQLPANRERALDVGCGRGELAAELASHFSRVVGVDQDAGMVVIANERCAALPGVTVRNISFVEVTGTYDLLTMVAVLHHLELGTALQHASELLADGGRLLIVGLARSATAADLMWDLVSSILNPLVGLAKHPRAVSPGGSGAPFPLADPELTFDEIKGQAASLLPGMRMRHRLFFRYTLEWTKPRSGFARVSPSSE